MTFNTTFEQTCWLTGQTEGHHATKSRLAFILRDRSHLHKQLAVIAAVSGLFTGETRRINPRAAIKSSNGQAGVIGEARQTRSTGNFLGLLGGVGRKGVTILFDIRKLRELVQA